MPNSTPLTNLHPAFRSLRSLALAALSGLLLAAAQSDRASLRVTSTFDGRTTLPLLAKWIVNITLSPDTLGLNPGDLYFPPEAVEAPEEDIASVTYFVDGVPRWIARHKPYTYGGWAGYLVTTWLTPGAHTFMAKVTTTDGQTAMNTVTATVGKAPAPPAALAGMWSRTRTDVNPQLSGRWNLILDEVGLWVTDPTNGGAAEQISVQGDTLYVYQPIQMGLSDVGVPAYGASSISGHMCDEGSHFWLQFPLSTFKWSVRGDMLTIRTVKAGCEARQGILEGTWTRVKNPPPRGLLNPGK